MKRLFDVISSSLLLVFFAAPMALIALGVMLTSRGSVLHWSDRVGRSNRIFKMPKFRSMRIDTPQLPTHLLSDPAIYLTPIGSFLRRTSLDELPQLFSILAGHLSMVGPRPALFNQDDLISFRTERGIHQLVPGLTGWAQVNGRDELPILVKVQFDDEYLQRRSFMFDLQIIGMTVVKVVRGEGIKH
jgi:O-antigen biosynthesis protein WbqP